MSRGITYMKLTKTLIRRDTDGNPVYCYAPIYETDIPVFRHFASGAIAIHGGTDEFVALCAVAAIHGYRMEVDG